MPEESPDFTRRLHSDLATVDRQDWQLWILVFSILAILAIGLPFIIYPAVFLGQPSFVIQTEVSAEAVLASLLLIICTIAYFCRQQKQIKKSRYDAINMAVQHELSHAPGWLDHVTQAFNSCALETIITKELKRADRTGAAITFIYVGITESRGPSVRRGHLVGDLILAETASILKRSVRGCDYVIRLAGEEFLVVLVDTDSDGATFVKERFCKQTETWNQSALVPGFTLKLSIGIAAFTTSQSLERAMADAKRFAHVG